jgi:hypothetical protein
MEITRDAPATAADERFINADPATVFSVLGAIDGWPSWNSDVKSARLDGPLEAGTIFRWKAGPASLVSTLQVVEPPREIGWTGKTMGIRAVHVFALEPQGDGTLVRSEESWEGLIPTVLKGYSRRTLAEGIEKVLTDLKAESERRTRAV